MTEMLSKNLQEFWKHAPVENLMTESEYRTLAPGSKLTYDIECYPNYFCIRFKDIESGKMLYFEQSERSSLNSALILEIMFRFETIGFNSINYDNGMLQLACKGASNAELKAASDYIISGHRVSAWQFRKEYNLKNEFFNHVDIMDVLPLTGSMKLYAARLHYKIIQDLPFEHDRHLTFDEMDLVSRYCINDVDITEFLYRNIEKHINLRRLMSVQYKVDLRSKSDAQIAETVIDTELKNRNGGHSAKRPKMLRGSVKFKPLDEICFSTPLLQHVYKTVCEAEFELDAAGKPLLPATIKKLDIVIGSSKYKIGMGGLHSSEKTRSIVAGEGWCLFDIDVESFYPRSILNQGLYPPHIGALFLEVYNYIVTTRLKAKAEGRSESDTLKIVINGLFGKFGSSYSIVYAAQLMLQVTLTGQLVLLMLVEAIELMGISVVSGNTDGIIVHCKVEDRPKVEYLVSKWEQHLGYKMEFTDYKALYNRDVNNYFTVTDYRKENDPFLDNRLGAKTKGAIAERGSALNSPLSKSPENLICTDAVLLFAIEGVPVEKTIRECRQIERFLTVANVGVGAVKDGEYIGKVVRWYYAKGEKGHIERRDSGNKVPRSEGGKLLQILPDEMPTDLDYEWYIAEAEQMLLDFGVVREKGLFYKKSSLF